MADSIEQALAALDNGEVVVVPTDTVYGLAARLDRPQALASIFDMKGRPPDKPLPVLAAGAGDLEAVAIFDDAARRLAAAYWPGPLTLVLPRNPGFTADIGGARDDPTVGVRVPDEVTARELLTHSGPLAVTSANVSGSSPAASVEEAKAAFGDRVRAYLDGGAAGGTPSTVVSMVGEPAVLREGAIAGEELLAAIRV
jgi:L-threonylcarbamoyladenylate synthase